MTEEEAVAAARKVAEADGWSFGVQMRAEYHWPWLPWRQHPWWDVEPVCDKVFKTPRHYVRLDAVTGEVIDKYPPGPGPDR
jgi:hypothetical protein